MVITVLINILVFISIQRKKHYELNRITLNNNKAYRPNTHLLDIFMQLKYQFAIRARFIISIKRLLVLLPVYFCMQYLETMFNKETYMMNGHNFNGHTVYAITQCIDH